MKFGTLTWICFLINFTLHAQNTDDVLDKYYEVTGGKENWESLKSYKTVYTLKEKEGEYVEESSFGFPASLKVIQTTKKGLVNTYSIDENEAYEIVNGQKESFEGQSLEVKKETALFLPLLYRKDFKLNLENLGLKSRPLVGGWNFGSNNNCVAIQRNFKNDEYIIYYFDTVTGYLVQEISSNGSYRTYLKYKEFNDSGFLIPTKIVSSGAGFSRTYDFVSAEFTKGEKPAFEHLLIEEAPPNFQDSSVSLNSAYKRKLALVVGNSNYANGGTLKNPINDARSMQNSLLSLGFEVIKLENASLDQLKKGVDAFGKKLQEYEVGLFYYAGHGIQFNGSNYLIPVEADLKYEHQVEFDCLSADRVLRFMEISNSKVNIIILDACRNNPFERSWRRSGKGQGLAFINAPTGTLIAYATSPGSTADDGNNGNGLYTEALLKYMVTPGIPIEQVFKLVRAEVESKSRNTQTPWESTSLKGEFCFVCQ